MTTTTTASATATATATAPPRVITADELLAMPRQAGRRYELIRGVLVEKMPTGDAHALVVAIITTVLSMFVGPRGYGAVRAGEPGYTLEVGPPDTVMAPDVAWIAPGRMPPSGATGFPQLAPDLAVEVKSPGDTTAALARKAEMWLHYGARQVWAVDPERLTLTQYTPGAAPLTLGEWDTLDGGELLPGFRTPVWRLFRWAE